MKRPSIWRLMVSHHALYLCVTPCIILLWLQAVQLVREVTFQQVALGLLYHISQDDRHKSMFIYTDAVTVILDLLMRVDDLTTTPELIALAVNLTQNDRIAEVWH